MKYEIRQLIIISLFFTLSLATSSEPAAGQEDASLTKISGEVMVFEPERTRGQKGRLGLPILVGYIIVTTGENSSADVTFTNGSVVRIMSDSKLEIKESYFEQRTFRVRLKLLTGKIFNVVREFARGSIYEAETLTAVVGVRGTIWSAETADQAQDVFMVKQGVVAAVNPVAAPGVEVLVGDLKKTIVERESAPTEPEPLSPEEIAMFDILNDLVQQTEEDIREEIMESIKQDIMEDAIRNQ